MTEPPPRKHPLWRRFLLVVLEGVAAFAGIVLLAAVLLGVRLAEGPLEVDWLTSALTETLNDVAAPLTVTLEGTSIGWDANHPTIDLNARDLRITDPNGTPLLKLPTLAVSLSVPALLKGRLAPTRLVATAPHIVIVRSAAGQIGVEPSQPEPSDEATPDYAPPSEPWPQFLRSLSGKPSADDPLGLLVDVSVVHAEITVDDRQEGLVWRMIDGTAGFLRSAAGLDMRVAGRIGVDSAGARVRTTAHLDTSARTVRFEGSFSGFDPSQLAPSLRGPARAIGELRLPISGHAEGVLDVGAMSFGDTRIRLHADPGTIVDPRLSSGSLAIRRLDLEAAYDPAGERLDLDRFTLDLGGPVVDVGGAMTGLGIGMLLGHASDHKASATVALALHHVPLDRFAALWPPDLASDARSWITANLSAGVLDTLSAQATAQFDPNSDHPVTQPTVAGTYVVKNATVNYLDGLPKLEGVDATIAFTQQHMDFAISAGRLKGLTVPKGVVSITDLDKTVQQITIDMGMKGPALDVMQILDLKRLNYARAVGLDPSRVSGAVDGTLHFRFPLVKELPFSDVEYGAQIQLADLAITGIAFDRDLTQGSFALVLDHNHISLDGDGRLDDVPAKVSWRQRISGDSAPLTEVHAKATLDDHARQRFDLDPIPDILHGPVDAEAVYRVFDDHRSAADVKLDLTPSDLTVDLAAWEKPAETPGTASFTVTMRDEHVTSVDDLVVRAADLDLRAGLTIKDGSVTHAAISHLALGGTDTAGSIEHAPNAPWQINLRGPALDFRPIRKYLAKSSAEPDVGPGVSLAIDEAHDKVIVADNKELRQVKFHGTVAHHALTSAGLSAVIGPAGKLNFHLERLEDGGKFGIQSDDLGALFQVAGITDHVVGGSVDISGTSVLEGEARRFNAHAEGKDYRVIGMPFIARLLSLASFQTMASLMAGQGITFTALKADLSLKQGHIDLSHGRAYGGAIGVNADGWFDINAGALSLEGTLVPAYTLNSALGGVPILGKLIVGGEGEGLFGANVSVYGKIAEPTISVNPLSALAPGFLRNLFLFDAPGPGLAPPPKKP